MADPNSCGDPDNGHDHIPWRPISPGFDTTREAYEWLRAAYVHHDGTPEWEFQDCSVCGGAQCGDPETHDPGDQ